MASPATATRPVRLGFGRVARAYFLLTKPRIVELLLITTVPMMIVAQRGLPPLGLVLATLVGGSLAAGGANTFNCWLDRDIDALMARTRNRPLPAGEVSPTGALVFGFVLEVVAFAWLDLTVNRISAVLAVCATAFYVFVYTIGLKRSSPQNIVVGGAAGAVPVLIGWAAVTGEVAWAPLFAFLVVFYWTPPHFWALAIKYRDDYAAAGVPMLPVVAGFAETARYVVVYSWVMVAVSLAYFAVARLGLLYLAVAILLGGLFLARAYQLRRTPTAEKAMRLFHFSITYLALLFAAMAVDVFVS